MKKPRVRPIPRAGFGNPPKHSRFQKGRSGNPKGRPKGSKNISTALQALLDKKFTVTENGEKKRLTGSELVATKLFAAALSTNPKAIQVLLEIEGRRQGDAGADPTSDSELDMTILDAFRARYDPKAPVRGAKTKQQSTQKKGKQP